ncbi:MAG: hypothetical protein SV775_01780 [Thermodesulfobacteriota bacterium]|nr:hypothetical protein [Thermodesulfobacteriota bacterium]
METYESLTTSKPDRRHSLRIKRTGLFQNKLKDTDRPSIRIAETREEFEQAFALVYREYERCGYLRKNSGPTIYLSIHNMLPETIVFISNPSAVTCTLTLIFDSKLFGLPMDDLYREELNILRDANRKTVQISSLATCPEFRGRNYFMYLFRAAYLYAKSNNSNDICIAVNPKHVEFYKTMLLFDDLGPEKFYDSLGAPAVALRLNLDEIEGKFSNIYSEPDCSCDLNSFFHGPEGTSTEAWGGKAYLKGNMPLDPDAARYFFVERTNVLKNASPEQMNYIRAVYPGLK